MPITGDTPQACFKEFRDHLGELIATTVTEREPVLLYRGADETRRTLQLGRSGTVSLASSAFGTIYFHMAQDLEAVRLDRRRYRLRTRHYWYKVLSDDPKLTEEPLFRWEYVAEPPAGKQWCKHHFQVGKVADPDRSQAVTVPLGSGLADLNRLHVPTGFVLVEYVIRFLISDLGVAPPCGDEWPDKLAKSESMFFREFSPKTSTPPV